MIALIISFTCVTSSAVLRYSTPRVSGGSTSATTGNSPLSLPPTIRKLKIPSWDVTTVTSLTSLDQWAAAALGPPPSELRLIEFAEDRGDFRSAGDRFVAAAAADDEETGGAGDTVVLLLSLYLLGVVGLFRCFNMVTPLVNAFNVLSFFTMRNTFS